MNHRTSVMRFLDFFNYKLSLVGAFVMGSMVFYINIRHGYLPAGIAASKQILYTFFIGGMVLKVLDAQLKWHKSNFPGILWSVLITTLLTTLLVYTVHSLKGTPEPFFSTVPTIFLAPIGFTSVALQKKHFKKDESEEMVAADSHTDR